MKNADRVLNWLQLYAFASQQFDFKLRSRDSKYLFICIIGHRSGKAFSAGNPGKKVSHDFPSEGRSLPATALQARERQS